MLFYHATNLENLGSIMANGIKAGTGGVVFLTDSPSDSAKFLAIKDVKNIVSIAVDLDEDKVVESFDHSEAFFKCKAYMYYGDITPDKIYFDKSIKYEL